MTPSQRAATLHQEGPALVLASPGSGKTRCITYRIVELVNAGTNPNGIVAITFTNKAANEMRQRISKALPITKSSGIHISTFHAFCARLLRKEHNALGISEEFTICDGDDSKEYTIQAISKVLEKNQKYVEELNGPEGPRYQANYIAKLKMKLRTPEELLNIAVTAGVETKLEQHSRKVYEQYQKILQKASSLDFADLLMKAVILLRDNEAIRYKYSERIKYLLVDEYQDTNPAQYLLAKLLASYWKNIYVVGDQDQSIYMFNGAEPENIFRFERDFKTNVKIYLLEENFRSTPEIAEAANHLIRYNTRRKEKSIKATRPSGPPVRCVETQDDYQEARFVVDDIVQKVNSGRAKWSDFAILYRTHSKSRHFEEILVTQSIPHVVIGGVGFYGLKVVKSILAYMRLRINKFDDASFKRIHDVPPRRLGDLSFEALYKYKEEHNCSFIELFTNNTYINPLKKIKTVSGGTKLKNTLEKIYNTSTDSAATMVQEIITASGLRVYYEKNNDSKSEDLDILDELIEAAREFDTNKGGGVVRFLEWTALMQSKDDNKDDPNKITLMTCHASKGLEFKNIYVVSVTDGYMPFIKQFRDDDTLKSEDEIDIDIEEERRVFFVAITRAEHGLTITHNRFSVYGNKLIPRVPSRFLGELGDDVTHETLANIDTRGDRYNQAKNQPFNQLWR